MIKSGSGGGNTRTGLVFEGKTDLSAFLDDQPHYSVVDHDVFYDGKRLQRFIKNTNFTLFFLKSSVLTGKNIFQKDCFPMTVFLCYLTMYCLL